MFVVVFCLYIVRVGGIPVTIGFIFNQKLLSASIFQNEALQSHIRIIFKHFHSF